VKGREKSRDEAGDKGMRMEGTGGPLSQIPDTPLTVQCTAYTGPQVQHGL
jgi:hypothetical protein